MTDQDKEAAVLEHMQLHDDAVDAEFAYARTRYTETASKARAAVEASARKLAGLATKENGK